MAENDVVSLAQKLASKCSISHPRIITEITVQFISQLYDRICQPFLEEPPILPDMKTEPKEHLVAILESLSCNFLNLDLDALVRVEDIMAQDAKSLHLLLRIFDNLYDCLAVSSDLDQGASAPTEPAPVRKKPSPSRRRFIGPTYMGKRITDMRSASVVYSPRTVALRQMRRFRSAQERPVHPIRSEAISRPEKSRTDAARRQIGGVKTDQTLDSSLHRIHSSLHRHHLAVDKRRARIAVEAAKASIRNSSAKKRHLAAMTKRAIGDLLSKNVSNHIKLEHVKEKARKALLEQLKDGAPMRHVDPRQLRLLSELGEQSQNSDHGNSSIDRTRQSKEIRALLSDLSSKVLC